jgi:hypothetical protein
VKGVAIGCVLGIAAWYLILSGVVGGACAVNAWRGCEVVSTILGLTASMAAGVLLGTVLTLSRIVREDDRTARQSRHQRYPRADGRGG